MLQSSKFGWCSPVWQRPHTFAEMSTVGRNDSSLAFLAWSPALGWHASQVTPASSLVVARFTQPPGSPAKTLAEYVAWVKSDPAKNGFYASAASGSIPHFFGVMFAKSAGLTLTHVPYKGTAAAMTAIAGGEVSAISTVAADIRALVQGGKARLLAVAGEQRDATFPDVPTFRELGYDLVAKPWYGLFAPAGTPADTVAQLNAAVAKAVRTGQFRSKVEGEGLVPAAGDPAQLGDYVRREQARWRKVIQDTKIKAE